MMRTSREGRRTEGRAGRELTAGAIGGAALLVLTPAVADAATIPVTSLEDSGPGTLRAAAAEASLTPGTLDEIVFQSDLSGTIDLESEITLSSQMDVIGPGSDLVTIDGGGTVRHFNVDADVAGAPGDPISISGLDLANGYGIADGGSMIVRNTEFSLDSVVVRDSKADDNGGAFDIEDFGATVTDSTFKNNRSYNDGGGAIYTNAIPLPGGLSISGSTFEGNYTDGGGGAIYSDSDSGNVYISDSAFTGNESTSSGGGIYMPTRTDAGAVVSISGTLVSGNIAEFEGGGIDGGGGGASFTIENTTISGNSAGTRGAGFAPTNGHPALVRSSTITDNTAPEGSGIYTNSAQVTLENTIVSGNNGSADLAEDSGTFYAGFSLVGGDLTGLDFFETTVDSNIYADEPGLGPLANNGGSTSTHLPDPGSVVLDQGISGGLGTDQRGFIRPVDIPVAARSVANSEATGADGADIGAVELQLPGTVSIDKAPVLTRDTTPTVEFSSDQEGDAFECSLDGADYAPCTSPLTFEALDDGDHTFAVRATRDGLTGSPLVISFTVDTEVTDADVTAQKKQKQGGKKVKIKLKGGAQEDVSGVAKGKINVKGKKKSFKLKKVKKSTGPGQQKVYRLKLKKKKDNKKVLKLLEKGKKLTANPSLKLTDTAGNKVVEKRVVRLKPKK